MTVLLPDEAKSKLLSLQLTKGAASDAMLGAGARLNSLPRDADRQMRDRLESERQKHAHRHNQLNILINKILQWQGSLRGVELQTAPQVRIEARDDETLGQAIGTCRDAISQKKQQLAAVRSAPLPRADKVALIEQYVLRLARQAKPTIGVVGDRIKIDWVGDTVMVEDTAALIAWLDPALLCEALCRELDSQPERSDAMSAAERSATTRFVEAELEQLERAEEQMICAAAESGIDLLRRPDALPAAVLSVVVVSFRETQTQGSSLAASISGGGARSSRE
jgi:hypothetical protein